MQGEENIDIKKKKYLFQVKTKTANNEVNQKYHVS